MVQEQKITSLSAARREIERTLLLRVIWLIDVLDDGESPVYKRLQDSLEMVIDGRLVLPGKRPGKRGD